MRVRSSVRGVLALFAASGALAEDFADGAPPVTPSMLEELRGGVELPTQLIASLSLERTAHLNGELVAHLAVEIPDIANMTVEQATALAGASGVLLIQNGPNNAFSMTDLGLASTVIQNTLSDQHLVALTTINVEVNTLAAFREMNFQDGVSQLLSGIPGVR